MTSTAPSVSFSIDTKFLTLIKGINQITLAILMCVAQ